MKVSMRETKDSQIFISRLCMWRKCPDHLYKQKGRKCKNCVIYLREIHNETGDVIKDTPLDEWIKSVLE